MLKECKYCGKKFEPATKGTRQKYCCEECRKAATKENRKRSPLSEKICPVCKKAFMPNTANQVTCSKDCKVIYEREQRKIKGRENYINYQRPKKNKAVRKSKGIAYDTLTPEQKFFYGRTQEKAYADEIRVFIPKGLTKFNDRKAV